MTLYFVYLVCLGAKNAYYEHTNIPYTSISIGLYNTYNSFKIQGGKSNVQYI